MPEAAPKHDIRVLRFLWAFFFGVAFVYWAIALASSERATQYFGLSWPNLNSAFELGVTLLALVTLVQFLHLSRRMDKSRQTGTVRKEHVSRLDLFRPWIIRWTVLDAVPLAGLLLAFSSHDAGKFTPFLAATIVGFLASYPYRNTGPSQ